MAAFFSRLIAIFIFSFLILSVAAQDPSPTVDPGPQEPSPSPSPSSQPSVSPEVPTVTSSVPVAPTSTPTLVPVFSTSADCTICKPNFGVIDACVQRIPKTANLTMITQVLPFYSCICPGDSISNLQHCSTCLRTTGQLNFLFPGLYNVTNQQVKAMRDVCTATNNGKQVPSGASSTNMEQLLTSTKYGVILSMIAIIMSLGVL
ncbi:hypothetical protein FBU30_003544 [Linnemannia zychae]|nr:hypothetical protein FBU30_003544 [Linnemannia zychae]